jgi:CRISPR-associated protein Csx10
MKAIAFSLHTQQPILATSFQGDPNSDVSYSYIPGSMIRGALIGRYMKQHHLSELDLNSSEVRRLFFDPSSTRYLNAYLLSREGKRTLPVPLSWFKDKDKQLPEPGVLKPMPIYDRAIADELPDEVTPKRVDQKFCTVDGESVVLYSEKRRINIHNLRDRKKGKGTEEEGEIFRYEALDAGQTFQAVILYQEQDEAIIQQLLDKPDLWLGGSQSAGYGHLKITEKKFYAPHTWQEIGISPEERLQENLTVTLLSDTLLRDDDSGQPTANAKLVRQAIQEILKKTLPSLSLVYANSTLIGGFNRKWGLPLPQVPALSAGSVFVFENTALTPQEIRQLEAHGIGERRFEGFGQITVNWIQEEELAAKKPDELIDSSQPSLKSEASRSLATQMAERLLEQKLEQEVQKKVGYLNLPDGISNSQLSRLWLVARQALPTGDCNLVLSLLNNLPSNASNQFEHTKLGNKSFKQQLYEWLQTPSSWISNSQELEVKIADVGRQCNDELAQREKLLEKYTLRLIMAVAKKATKETT